MLNVRLISIWEQFFVSNQEIIWLSDWKTDHDLFWLYTNSDHLTLQMSQ